MEQLTALKELAEKVEAGTAIRFSQGFTAFDTLGFGGQAKLAENAYGGSLDAAHALHKAVLGDRYEWSVGSWGTSIWADDNFGFVFQIEDRSTPRARLRLIAIIKAKIAELE